MIILALQLLYISFTDAFHISLNRFTFAQAGSYCIDHCHSNLASIHNETDYQRLITSIQETLNNEMIYMPSTTLIHIGLRATDPSDWKWTDGTQFNFGNDITGGIYPWNYGHPQSSNATSSSSRCTMIQMSTYYELWTTHPCAETYAIFACNHCHETLTKYSIITDVHSRSTHASRCSSSYGTELMSMHSAADFEQASLICTIAADYDCYVGLYWNRDLSLYLWQDGTPFDYASQLTAYPWSDVPNPSVSNCTNIDGSHLSSAQCTVDQYAICNLPSEICYRDIWSSIAGFGWTFATKPCAITNDNHTERGLAIIATKQWDNYGNHLVFEYIFAINQVTENVDSEVTANVDSTAGVVWYINGTCSPHYYIAISIPNNEVFIAYVSGTTITNLAVQQLPAPYQVGDFVVLRGEIASSNTFTISVDEHTLLQNIEGMDLFTSMIDTSIGFIGIMNTKSSIVARSLFVSGDPILDVPQSVTQWLIDCAVSSSGSTTTLSSNDDDDGEKTELAPATVIALVAVIIILSLCSCCVWFTVHKIRSDSAPKRQSNDARHHHDPEEIVNIQMQKHLSANMKQPAPRAVNVKVIGSNEVRAPPVRKEENAAHEFERALVAAWFENDVGLPQYYKIFIRNGYESMRIIKEIEDRAQLAEIGITLIGHQTMILSEIQRYNIQSHVNITAKGGPAPAQQKDGYRDTDITGIPQRFYKQTLTFGSDDIQAIQPGAGEQPGEFGPSLPSSFVADDIFGTYKQ